MPRVTLSPNEEKNRHFKGLVVGNMKRYGVTRDRLCKAANISERTHYNRLKKPDDMTLSELRTYKRLLHISDEDILEIL